MGHPLQITVEVLDPIRRGQVVRVRFTIKSSLTFESAEVRLEPTGDVKLTTEARVPLGTLQVGMPASAEFQLHVPREGSMPLQFVVLAGEDLKVSRGVTIELLHDGPQQLRSVVVQPDGSRIELFSAWKGDR